MQSSTMIRRTRVEVDLAAIVGNARTVGAITGTDAFAVVQADGYGHGAVAVARALTGARRVPLIGVVSMNITVADVTDVPGIAIGDAAVLLGRASGGASISVAEYGAWAGLSEYEVTCGMSNRVPRTYVGDPL
jgi:alanine racemase